MATSDFDDLGIVRMNGRLLLGRFSLFAFIGCSFSARTVLKSQGGELEGGDLISGRKKRHWQGGS